MRLAPHERLPSSPFNTRAMKKKSLPSFATLAAAAALALAVSACGSKYSESAPPADKTPNSVHYWNGWKVSEFKDTNSDSRASALYFFAKDDSPQAKTPDSDYEAPVKIAPLSDGTALGFVNDKHSDSRGRGFYVQIDKNGNAAPISTTMTQPSGKTTISIGQAALSEKVLAGTKDASHADAQGLLAQAKAYRKLAAELEERARSAASLSSSKPGFN